MAVPMPAIVVLIVCKVAFTPGPPDSNDKFTGHQNLEWAMEHSMMVCRREEVTMFDQAAALGAPPMPFSRSQCMMSAMQLATAWDSAHRGRIRMAPRTSSPGHYQIVGTQTLSSVRWTAPYEGGLCYRTGEVHTRFGSRGDARCRLT